MVRLEIYIQFRCRDKKEEMNLVEEYFWKAKMAFQTNRLTESCTLLCQAMGQLKENELTLEQIELMWSVIPSMLLSLHPIDKCLNGVFFRNDYKSANFN